MQNKQAILLGSIGLVFALASMAFYFRSIITTTVARIPRPWQETLPKSTVAQPSLQLQFVDNTGSNFAFKLKESFPYSDQYYTFLENSPILGKNIIVSITNNPEDAEAKAFKDGELVSGFSFAEEETALLIDLYVSSGLDRQQQLHQINNSFLTALLHASEISKQATEFPQLTEANALTHDISVESYDTNNYALQEL